MIMFNSNFNNFKFTIKSSTIQDIPQGTAGDDLLKPEFLDSPGYEIKGLEGNDTIYGSDGNDTLDGGEGNDELYTDGVSSDSVDGGIGDDSLYIGYDTLSLDPIPNNIWFSYFSDSVGIANGSGEEPIFITYTGIESIYIQGGLDADTFDVSDVSEGRLDIDGGINIFGGENSLKLSPFGNNDVSISYPNTGLDGNILGTTSGGITFRNIDSFDITLNFGSNNIDLSGATGSVRVDLNISSGTNTVYGGSGQDFIYAGYGDDFLSAGGGNDSVLGGDGFDILYGDGGNDSLIGIDPTYPNTSFQIDNLTGGTGADTFVLGDERQPFYYDGGGALSGGYALIEDFNPGEGDKIQLNGKASNYRLQVSGGKTNIIRDEPGTQMDELIGVINNTNPLSLNSTAFVYVDTTPTITLSISPSSVLEDGTANLIYTFTRNGYAITPLTVNYTIAGTATRGTDYANIGTSVNFAAGSATATVMVNPTPDSIKESDETVILSLTDSPNYNLGATIRATGIIQNDDPTIALSVSPVKVQEDGISNLVYTFTRTSALTEALTVNYKIGGTATFGRDYSNIGTSVTFAPGSSVARVTVDPTADSIVEADETVSLTLVNSANYVIGTTTAVTGTIANDDVLPRITLAVSPATVAEDGTSNIVYTFTRTARLADPLTVNYTVGGTATRGTDYGNILNSVTFAPDISVARVVIDPLADNIIEADETVSLTLTSLPNYTIGTTSAVTATLTDGNDLLIGTSANNNLSGGSGNDSLYGLAGNDTIIGGRGNDFLSGGTGADHFLFNASGEGIDTISDFNVTDDTIRLSASGFTLPLGVLAAGAFRSGAGVTSAVAAADRLLYNTTNGALYFDSDGNGASAALQLAILSNRPALTNADFLVV